MKDFAGVLFPIRRPRVTLPYRDQSFRAYRKHPHAGVDVAPFPGSTGEPIKASCWGVVHEVNRYGDEAGIGNEVIIKTRLLAAWGALDINNKYRYVKPDQVFWLRYGHMQEIHVGEGNQVFAGDRLGTIGSTGFSFGPHLHLEVRLGEYDARWTVDPMDLFVAWVVGLRQEIVYA